MNRIKLLEQDKTISTEQNYSNRIKLSEENTIIRKG